MASTGWIFVDWKQDLEVREADDGSIEDRVVTTFIRKQIHTDGTIPSLLADASVTNPSAVVGPGTGKIITIGGTLEVVSDELKALGDPIGVTERVQILQYIQAWG